MYSRVGFCTIRREKKRKRKEERGELENAMLFCTLLSTFVAFFPSFFFPNSFPSFVGCLERRKNLPAMTFSLFFFFFFFKSLLFPHKKRALLLSVLLQKKSFEANGARGRLDEEGSLNDTAGGLSRLLRRRRRLFFSRRCFEGFLEGLPRVVHTKPFGRSRSNFWREVIV